MATDFSKYGAASQPSQPAPGTDFSKYGALNSFQTLSEPPKPSIGQRVLDAGTSVANNMGLGATADYLGTNIANIANVLNPFTSIEEKIRRGQALPQANIKQSVGAGLQLGSLAASGGGAPATLLGRTALSGALGGAQTLGSSMAGDQSADAVVSQGVKGAATSAALTATLGIIGKAAERLGNKISFSVIKPTQADIKDGFSIDTINKYKLGGSLNTTLQKTQGELNRLTVDLNTKLSNAKTSVDLNKVFKDTLDDLTDASKLKGFGANAKIQNTIQALKSEVDLLADDAGSVALSVPDAQVVKQAAGHFGAWQYGKVDPDSKASEIVYNTFYNKLKKAIEAASPEGVRELNKELSKLIAVNHAVIRRLPVAERAGAISLNEMIGLVGTSLNPVALGPTILAMISRSGTAGAAINSAGQALGRAALPIGALSGPPAVPSLDTAPEETPQSQLPYENPTTQTTRVNDDGSITTVGPFSGKEFTIDPNAVGGTIKNTAKLLPRIKAFFKAEPPYALIKNLEDYVAAYDSGFKDISPLWKDRYDLEGTVREQLERYDFPTADLKNPVDLARAAGAILDKGNEIPRILRDAKGRFMKQ